MKLKGQITLNEEHCNFYLAARFKAHHYLR